VWQRIGFFLPLIFSYLTVTFVFLLVTIVNERPFTVSQPDFTIATEYLAFLVMQTLDLNIGIPCLSTNPLMVGFGCSQYLDIPGTWAQDEKELKHVRLLPAAIATSDNSTKETASFIECSIK
jgi:hypothetical protein